ncbi:anthranilate synthase component I family protein [Companilactobacillus versmoldensis]|uniref:anthranilate synthase n=1 Tax=Companilactobacillus versmoldensis DSM 14857 = KCTC 3814 TaxID=1423815 RepID=A0A0R1SF78_9LACO|nr:anthranilate synthase component I family protein [Companilactobacillus versmoldensis]KRL67401.1 anthranilate synthase [Companilactobacillus versmoldensis DSM 14857 = KCTC 3814]
MEIEKLQQSSIGYPAVPITLEFKMADFDPVALTNNLKSDIGPCFLFTGHPKPDEDGYSFIGVDPVESLSYRNGQLTIQNVSGIKKIDTNLKNYLEKLLNKFKTPRLPSLPPFLGGLAGYFAYDYARFAETSLSEVADPDELNDADFLLFDKVIAYDHKTQTVTLSKIVPTENFTGDFQATQRELSEFKQLVINNNYQSTLPNFELRSDFKLKFDAQEFAEKVSETKQHIVDGDIFQLILSNPQSAQMSGSLFPLTKTLFHDSPAPYQFYYQHGNFETVGSSPETLIAKHGQKLFTYPLAGTRRRGKTDIEDQRLAYELTHSPKEVAEHNMLIDLGRNDLGKISQFGTVEVTQTRKLRYFSNVMHMGSTVESQVAKNVTPVQIVESLMPAGTLSGAPKIRAMQLISDLEKQKRGIYGGCLGYFDFSGELDFCIGIRLAYRQNNHLVVHSGAGIVADSVAKNEYQEFNNKAKNVIDAIQKLQASEVIK